MTLTILLTLLGTSIDTILLCYCTKYFNFRYSYIKSGILYTLWGLSIILLNLLSCPFIFKLIYELFSIIFLNRYLYLDFQLKSTLKMIVVFYIVLCLCELLTVGICFSVLHCTSLSDIFDNQVLSLEMIIFSKILSLLLLHIDSLLNDLSKSSYAIHTGNPFIDVLISEKLKLIHEQHISCKMNVELENIHFIRNIELCSLLGNLLDNCIEATQCCDKNRSITFCCNTTQNHFCIHASNTYNKKLKYKNGSIITTKKDSSMHGFGIISIKKIVSKYNGNVSFSSNLEEFVVNISIPLPQNLN